MASDQPNTDPEEFPTTRGLSRGQRVGSGRYLLKDLLGQGGMGVVWLAHDDRLKEDVALKFLPQQLRLDVSALDDLRQETLKSRKLAHPNIIRIHDLFEAKGEDPFISMEYVDGPTLSVRRSKQPTRVLQWQDLSGFVGQLCEALQYAHNEQVIHRDLKPANLMLNSRQQVKLADFGIARVVTDSVSRLTMRQGTSGTLVYMSPQQLDGKPSNPTDDIYSVGATLYELLASKPPFYTGEIAHQIRYVEADTVSKRLANLRINNDVPPIVEETLASCLKKDPSHRPQTARELGERFGVLEARPPSSRSRTRQKTAVHHEGDDTTTFRRKKNTPLIVGGVVAALGVAAVVWSQLGHKNGGVTPPAMTNSAAAVTTPVVATSPPAPPPIQAEPAQVAVAEPIAAPTNKVAVVLEASPPPAPRVPVAGHPWTNSLNMRFAPLPGTGLLLSIWETRVADYEAFVADANYKEDGKWRRADVRLSPTHPVANVNFEDSTRFCEWLTATERAKGSLLTNQSYRLPTDLEWSAAVGLENETGRTPMARNGDVLRRYPWGDKWPPPPGAGNFAGKELADKPAAIFIREYQDPFVRTAPVGSFTPTKDGFYDLAGNVWEWCSDYFGNGDKSHVLRGGAWDSAENTELLSSYRNNMGPLYRLPTIGFRCVLDPGRPAGGAAPAAKN